MTTARNAQSNMTEAQIDRAIAAAGHRMAGYGKEHPDMATSGTSTKYPSTSVESENIYGEPWISTGMCSTIDSR